jgi:hypothetical protein
MGVDYQGLRFLLSAKRAGVSFEHPVMLGRQEFFLSMTDAAHLMNKFDWRVQQATLGKWLADRYIEPFLEMMGAKDIASIDASPYEGATIVHDLNQPLPSEMKNRFSVVIEFGTLEHIFNYPQALKNGMELVSLGGHFLAVTPCNGWTGHGFYQFSPELFFRAFSPENGFDLEHQYLCQNYSNGNGGEWYSCVDPKVLNRRAEIVTACQTSLLIQAKRTKICDVFSSPPQQSDYIFAAWAGTPIQAVAVAQNLPPLWKRLIPKALKRSTYIAKRNQRAARLKVADRTAFQPVDDD